MSRWQDEDDAKKAAALRERRLETRKLVAQAIYVPIVSMSLGGLWAWPTMLGLGALHDHFPAVPPLGYFETWIVMITINIIGSAVKTGIKLNPEKK